jgi:hypothetical protein
MAKDVKIEFEFKPKGAPSADEEERREGARRLLEMVREDEREHDEPLFLDFLAHLSAAYDVKFAYPVSRCGGCGEWRMASAENKALCWQCEGGA